MTRRFSALLLIFGCFACAATTEQPDIAPGLHGPAARFDVSDVSEFSGNTALENNQQKNHNGRANIYRINFGPQVVTVRASYRDNADPTGHTDGDWAPGQGQRYLDLRAASAVAGTNLRSEGEMAYNLLGSLDGNMRPAMFRLGLKNRWQGLSYGADYKAVEKGFIPIGGAIAEQSRDEAVLWGEHRFGLVNLRGSVGESWERLLEPAGLRVTRTAATALQIKQPRWAGAFSTSYGLTDQGLGQSDEGAVLINSLTTSFRPADFLLLEPNFSFKEEWNQSSGGKIQTPSSALSFTYSPHKSPFRLTGATSFSRIFNVAETSDTRIHGTSVALDWKLGKFLGRDDRLLFTFNYNRHLDHVFRRNSYDAVSSMLQFRITGF